MKLKFLWFIGVGLVLMLLVFGALIYWMTGPIKSKFPADQKLIALFTANRDAFDRLRKMADEDWGKQASFSAFDASSKLSPVRQQEYNNLLSKIGSGVVETRDYDGTTRFNLAGEGVAIGPTWEKGIVYVAGNYEKKGVIGQNLDDVSNLAQGVYLRPIEPNWFIFYQQTD